MHDTLTALFFTLLFSFAFGSDAKWEEFHKNVFQQVCSAMSLENGQLTIRDALACPVMERLVLWMVPLYVGKARLNHDSESYDTVLRKVGNDLIVIAHKILLGDGAPVPCEEWQQLLQQELDAAYPSNVNLDMSQDSRFVLSMFAYKLGNALLQRARKHQMYRLLRILTLLSLSLAIVLYLFFRLGVRKSIDMDLESGSSSVECSEVLPEPELNVAKVKGELDQKSVDKGVDETNLIDVQSHI